MDDKSGGVFQGYRLFVTLLKFHGTSFFGRHLFYKEGVYLFFFSIKDNQRPIFCVFSILKAQRIGNFKEIFPLRGVYPKIEAKGNKGRTIYSNGLPSYEEIPYASLLKFIYKVFQV